MFLLVFSSDVPDFGLGDDLMDGLFDLEMKDVPYVEWVINRNEFGLDYNIIFPTDLNKVVVTDPNFPVRGGICIIAVVMKL